MSFGCLEVGFLKETRLLSPLTKTCFNTRRIYIHSATLVLKEIMERKTRIQDEQ
jgi:hypothetical protein